MHEYVFKMKKGEIEIELKSDDLELLKNNLTSGEKIYYKNNKYKGIICQNTHSHLKKVK